MMNAQSKNPPNQNRDKGNVTKENKSIWDWFSGRIVNLFSITIIKMGGNSIEKPNKDTEDNEGENFSRASLSGLFGLLSKMRQLFTNGRRGIQKLIDFLRWIIW